MWTIEKGTKQFGFVCIVTAAALLACSCSHTVQTGVRTMPAGKEFSGYLSDYSKLKESPEFENTVSYVRDDPNKNIHKYVAIIVEPVQVYVATNADPNAISEQGRAAMANYFQTAIENAVGDAMPVVKERGPLVLVLRSALIGVDVGNETPEKGNEALEHSVNIGKVGIEVELVDSETGEQIAAAVDHQSLGAGANVGSAKFSREEKFRAATQAFDGWASRLREFLDAAHELSPADVARAEKTVDTYK